MEPIVGSWKATARQATLGETMIRPINHGEIADMVINADGTGYTKKQKMFGRIHKENLTWYRDSEIDGYIISVPDCGIVMAAALPERNTLMTRWISSLKSIDGMGVFYTRV